MTLIIQKPTGAKLVMAKNYPADDDSRAYIAAVEAADGQSLESGVKMAIDAFVLGCKADGIWTAIKTSCILAGARTLTGALVPLAGTAPTNVNFVDGDYNRKTGLVGNGSTKYLNSNRANNADPQDNCHMSVWASTANTKVGGAPSVYIGGGGFAAGDSGIFRLNSNGALTARCKSAESAGAQQSGSSTGFIGIARAASSNYALRAASETRVISTASDGNSSFNVLVYDRDLNPLNRGNARLAFYSIGESLDLALLDARVTTLINAFGAAIP
jgi:hypothetical protein